MNLPIQSQPVIRNVRTTAFASAIKASYNLPPSSPCTDCLLQCEVTYCSILVGEPDGPDMSAPYLDKCIEKCISIC